MSAAGGVTVREMRAGDVAAGFLESLGGLGGAGGMGEGRARELFAEISSAPGHVILVAESGGRVVGSATLLIERKFIHGGGLAGHIEDVVVDGGRRGEGIGRALVRAALERAGRAGCYKTVLDCSDGVAPFYEGIGFRRHSAGMRFDH